MTEKELLKTKPGNSKQPIEQAKVSKNVIQSMSAKEELEVYEEKIDEIRQEMMNSLTEIEKDVLGVAEEILKKKKFKAEIETERVETMSPMVEMIYSKSIARFRNQKGYKKDSIFNAIQSLEEKKWIITGQRVTKDEIMSNPIKKEIIAFIEKYPGVHARDEKIQQMLNITRNPFIKHMASLEAFDLVRSSKLGATLNYFPADLPEIFDDLAVVFQNEIVVDIIQMFMNDRNVTLMDLADKIGVYHRAIQYHIKSLVSHNVLIKISAEDVKLEAGEKFDSRRKYYKVNVELLKRYNKVFKIPPFGKWM